MINKLACPDGGWRTIDGAEIFGHKKSAGTVYQAALRNELTMRLQVSWTAVSKDGQGEIAGVPEPLLRLWSKRTVQVAGEAGPMIAVYEERLGRALSAAERTAVTKVAVLKTRPVKDRVDIESLSGRWHTEATDAGWTSAAVAGAVAAATGPRAGNEQIIERLPSVLAAAVRAAGDRRSVFTRSDLAAEIAGALPPAGLTAEMTRELIERATTRALATDSAVRLTDHRGGPPRTSDARYASRRTLQAELRVIARAEAGRGAGVAVEGRAELLAAARRRALDSSQLAALEQILTSGRAIEVLVAPAGTGKTTALGAAAATWQAAGHRLIALAPSARAARELEQATLIRADTVAKFLHEQAQPTPARPGHEWETFRYRLTPGAVLIVDEASMLPTRDLDTLTALTTAVGAKLLLVGDPAQIGAIDAAGGMLPALADRLAAPSLHTVHRFAQRWEREASLALRRGDRTVLDTYLRAGRLHHHVDDTAALDAVHRHYQATSAEGCSVLMLARTRADVDALNGRAHAHAIAAGTVHGPVLHDGPTRWRAGDRLRATRNTPAITIGGQPLRNGDHFTVHAATPDGLLVRSDTGHSCVLPTDYIDAHAVYGWAATIDGAQGATVDHAVLLARPGLDREHLYVGLTRGRHTNHLHLAPADNGEHHQPPVAGDAGDPWRPLTEALGRSGQQAAAHTRLRTDSDYPTADRPDPGRDRHAEIATHRFGRHDRNGPRGRAAGERSSASSHEPQRLIPVRDHPGRQR